MIRANIVDVRVCSRAEAASSRLIFQSYAKCWYRTAWAFSNSLSVAGVYTAGLQNLKQSSESVDLTSDMLLAISQGKRKRAFVEGARP